MKQKYLPLILLSLIFSLQFFSCEEDNNTLGSSLVSGEVSITIDTTIYNLMASPLAIDTFDSRSGNLLLGSINKPDFGSLNCSFVTRLMCSPNLQLADSLLLPERVDSCKLFLLLERQGITGDSLAPQKLEVFLLNKQLPSSIDNNFNPEGYYDPSAPLGSKSYTVSNIASSDSAFYNQNFIALDIKLDKKFGQEIFEKYKDDPSIFEWPQSLAERYIPGLFVKPTFGNGCIANINQLYITVYYYINQYKTTITDNDTVTTLEHIAHWVYPFATSPEVLSSNNITYKPSEKIVSLNNNQAGNIVLTTPGGYIGSFKFPAKSVVDKYKEKNANLATVNDLILSIPADTLEFSSDFSYVTNLLLVKKNEYHEFFEKNKIPDNSTSFTGIYNASTGYYVFTSMRNYVLELLKKDSFSDEDVEFLIVPVEITTETVSNSYYGTSSSYVTKCVPYTLSPTITPLKTSEARIEFSFSNQLID